MHGKQGEGVTPLPVKAGTPSQDHEGRLPGKHEA
jgi:hypothetical protein